MKFQLTFLSFLLYSQVTLASVVTINISNMAGEKGQMAVAVFNNPDSFPDQSSRATLSQFFPVTGGKDQMNVTLNLKPGRYAIAVFLDANKNQKLDTNFLGAPKERFGFSKNPKIGFSAPNFSECAFEVIEEKNQTLNIKLNKFF